MLVKAYDMQMILKRMVYRLFRILFVRLLRFWGRGQREVRLVWMFVGDVMRYLRRDGGGY
jgi:hypothetical protein